MTRKVKAAALSWIAEMPQTFIGRSFTPRRRVRTSSVPSDALEISPALWTERPKIKPTHFIFTMNASDFATDACRLTGRTGLCIRLSWTFVLAHRFRSPRFICGWPSRRACHADPAGDDSD